MVLHCPASGDHDDALGCFKVRRFASRGAMSQDHERGAGRGGGVGGGGHLWVLGVQVCGRSLTSEHPRVTPIRCL